MEYLVGIDIASMRSGISIIDINTRDLVYSVDIVMKSLSKYDNETIYFKKLKEKVKQEINIELHKNNTIFVLEKNFRHATLSKVFGMWLAILSDYDPLYIEYVSPGTWYTKLKLGKGNDPKEKRKQNSMNYMKDNINYQGEKISEDMADSFCIAMSWFED